MDHARHQLLTHSRMACAKACLRRHYYAFEMGLRPVRESVPLRIGGAFHKGLETFATAGGAAFEEKVLSAIQAATEQYEAIPQGVTDPLEWAIERVTVERLLHAYFLRYQNDGLNVVAVEAEFNLPLRNPESGAESRLFRLAGRIDRIVQLPDGRLACLLYTSDAADE